MQHRFEDYVEDIYDYVEIEVNIVFDDEAEATRRTIISLTCIAVLRQIT